MAWWQALATLAVWLAGGGAAWRGLAGLRGRWAGWSPSLRIAAMTAALAVSGAVLLGGLSAVSAAGGASEGPLTPGSWLAATAVGLAFVQLQTLAAALGLSAAFDRETGARRSPSDSPNLPATRHGENP